MQRSEFWFLFDPDPVPTFHPDADPDPNPDPDPNFQIKTQTLEKVIKWALIPYIVACHQQIDADQDPDPAYHRNLDPDPDFYLMRIWIRIFIWCGCGSRLAKLFEYMRIRIRIHNTVYDNILVFREARVRVRGELAAWVRWRTKRSRRRTRRRKRRTRGRRLSSMRSQKFFFVAQRIPDTVTPSFTLTLRL